MQINYPKAKALCTEAEFKLLSEAKPQALATHKVGELGKLATRARKAADKWREQSRKQGNSTTGAAARSVQKFELFNEALTRFEAKLEKLKAAGSAAKTVAKKSPAKKAASKKAIKAVAKKAAKKSVSTNARSAMSLANQAKKRSIGTNLRMAASGQNSRVRGHVSAQGRRNQAARSARKR